MTDGSRECPGFPLRGCTGCRAPAGWPSRSCRRVSEAECDRRPTGVPPRSRRRARSVVPTRPAPGNELIRDRRIVNQPVIQNAHPCGERDSRRVSARKGLAGSLSARATAFRRSAARARVLGSYVITWCLLRTRSGIFLSVASASASTASSWAASATSELPKRRGTVCVGECSDHQRLIDVAHRHAVLDEVDQLIKRHAAHAICPAPGAQLAAQLGESRRYRSRRSTLEIQRRVELREHVLLEVRQCIAVEERDGLQPGGGCASIRLAAARRSGQAVPDRPFSAAAARSGSRRGSAGRLSPRSGRKGDCSQSAQRAS